MGLRHACVLAASIALGTGACASVDPLRTAVETRAGPAAVACGLVLPGDDSSRADSCAVSAFRSGVPFWIGYGSCAADQAFETRYLVSPGAERLREIRYDTPRTRASSRFGAPRQVRERECVAALFQVTPGHFRVGCQGPEGTRPDSGRRAATPPTVGPFLAAVSRQARPAPGSGGY